MGDGKAPQFWLERSPRFCEDGQQAHFSLEQMGKSTLFYLRVSGPWHGRFINSEFASIRTPDKS